MTIESSLTRTGAQLGRDELAKIRIRAMRRGVWFRVLTRAERAQMELTMRVVKRIRSFFLVRVVSSIVVKLLDAMESKVSRLVREVGPALALKLSRIAQEWGNKSARKWAVDRGFLQYLTINYMNTPAAFQT